MDSFRKQQLCVRKVRVTRRGREGKEGGREAAAERGVCHQRRKQSLLLELNVLPRTRRKGPRGDTCTPGEYQGLGRYKHTAP